MQENGIKYRPRGLTSRFSLCVFLLGVVLRSPIASAIAQTPPAGAPSSSGELQELRRDLDDQRSRDQLGQSLEDLQKRLLQSRRDVQEIRIIRAKLKDFLDAKECAGAEAYLKRLDGQQQDAAALLSDLAQQCASANSDTAKNLAEACRQERAKLGQEVNEIKESRARFARQCPRPGS
jgi:TolA-binding protein